MDSILEIISCTRVTKKESSIMDLTIKDVEELFVFACHTGSLRCLLVLSKFGKFKKILVKKQSTF